MKIINLTQGYKTIIDDDDYEKFSVFKWYADASRKSEIRAVRSINRKGRIIRITLSREIMNAAKGYKVDHINHNTLDNRKSNLRLCTQAQNTRNRIKPSTNTSGFKGVSKQKNMEKWRAAIAGYYLGLFKSKEEAARAYDRKAKELFGEFASVNYG